MPAIDAIVECPVHDSFRVRQVAGMFDVPLAEKCRQHFRVEVPDLTESWQIGLIVGPSGSGKTTVARRAFGEDLYAIGDWPADKAVVDCLGDRPIKQITAMLTAVGFSSPPSWVKPYAVLSNGEKFRCDLARSLLTDRPLVVFDEFTSVVDRRAAQIGSAAVAKSLRQGNIACRFVAVACHYDIAEWLEPDWVLDMAIQSPAGASGTLARGRLRRPQIELHIRRCQTSAWRLFAKHHYLSAKLHPGAQCYLAEWQEEPVAFCAVLPLMGFVGRRRISRVVVLPDFQGVGIGTRFLKAVCRLLRKEGHRVSITCSHPALVSSLSRDPDWKCTHLAPLGYAAGEAMKSRGYKSHSFGRSVASFEFIGVSSV